MRLWVDDNCAPLIGVHTANPVARQRMVQVADKINAKARRAL